MYLCLSNWHTFVSWYLGMRKINFLKSNYIRLHSQVAKLAENHSLERVGKEGLVISHFYLSLPEPECSICRVSSSKIVTSMCSKPNMISKEASVNNPGWGSWGPVLLKTRHHIPQWPESSWVYFHEEKHRSPPFKEPTRPAIKSLLPQEELFSFPRV